MENFEKGAKRKCTKCSTLFFDFGKFPIQYDASIKARIEIDLSAGTVKLPSRHLLLYDLRVKEYFICVLMLNYLCSY